jgi:hypothetical protein
MDMQWWLIFTRGLVLPLLALSGGILLSFLVLHVANSSPYFGQLDTPARWIAHAGFGGTAVLLAVFGWRLYQWESGHGPGCQYCGGPLGRLREGKVYFGKQLSDYRRCYNCDRATPGT